MNKTKGLIYVILIGIFVYYIVPLLSNGMNNIDISNYSKMCVFFINSIYALISGFILTKLNGFKWYYSIISLLFLPSAIIIYNGSTIVYVVLYMLESMVGSSIYLKYKCND